MNSILEVKNLKTSFATSKGRVAAVQDVSFQLRPGEILGVVGESGSGKSVTLMSVLGLLASNGSVDNGEILFENVDLLKLSDKEMRKIRGRKISMIFQDPMSSLNPLIKVGKQVEEMITEHFPKKSKAEVKAEVLELFDKVQIPEPEKRYGSYPHEFSGGMRQRVMIAMALACSPTLLIADEPTTALDVTIQKQILNLLNDLKDEINASIIFITHDLGVVAELCSRIVVMYGGRVVEEGTTEQIFYEPSHPYTLGLLRSVPKINQNRKTPLIPIIGSPPNMLTPPSGCPFAARCEFARKICDIEVPEFYKINSGQYSLCHLHNEGAPEENNPFKGGKI